MDGERYALHLKRAYDQPFSEIFTIFEGLFAENQTFDFVQPTLTLFISLFTDSHHLLFAAFAFIFGYFQLKSIYAISKDITKKRNFHAQIFFLLMFFVLPIFEINGFRMWTASWVFFYGVYKFIVDKDRRFILVALFSMGIHFSFILPCLVLVGYVFLGNRDVLYLPTAVATFFLSELPIPAISGAFNQIGGGLAYKFKSYSHERYMETVLETKSQGAWFLSAPKWVLYCYVALLISIYIRMKRVETDKGFQNLFSFTLVFLSFANIASLIPSGGRFHKVFLVFGTAVLFIYFAKYYTREKLNKLVLISLVPIVIMVLVTLRVGMETLNTVLFLPSPIIMFNFDAPWPLKDFLL